MAVKTEEFFVALDIALKHLEIQVNEVKKTTEELRRVVLITQEDEDGTQGASSGT